MQSILLLVAPPIFASTVYMSLSRVIRSLNAQHISIVRPQWLTRIFVTSDVLCFLIQSSGGGLQATGSSMKLGQNIVLGGLILQVVIFGFFVAVSWNFHVRYSNKAGAGSTALSWKRCMYSLYTASALILLRNTVRIVEYAQGYDGYIMGHEAFIYVFDAVPMLALMVVTWFVHVGRMVQTVKYDEVHALPARIPLDRREDCESQGSLQNSSLHHEPRK